MSTTKSLTIETVNPNDRQEMDAFLEQVIQSGMQRVGRDIAELQTRGLMDGTGKLLVSDLPADMREGSERDFGG